jgi:hypothetical protein
MRRRGGSMRKRGGSIEEERWLFEEERWLNLRRRGGSMVAHLTPNQLSWVQIQLLPSTRQTLSVLRWVATWDDTVPCAGL